MVQFSVIFEWDEKKARLYLSNHGVSFHEAATVFGDPLAITFSDPDHSVDEHRLLTFGNSKRNRLLVVSHASERGEQDNFSTANVATRTEYL